VYLNFVTRIDRTLMEKLAQELVNSNSVSMVSKIYDQYLDVIALEPSLFTLNIKDSFMAYNEPSLSEAQIRYVAVPEKRRAVGYLMLPMIVFEDILVVEGTSRR
jgi:hypothetical protein